MEKPDANKQALEPKPWPAMASAVSTGDNNPGVQKFKGTASITDRVAWGEGSTLMCSTCFLLGETSVTLESK